MAAIVGSRLKLNQQKTKKCFWILFLDLIAEKTYHI